MMSKAAVHRGTAAMILLRDATLTNTRTDKLIGSSVRHVHRLQLTPAAGASAQVNACKHNSNERAPRGPGANIETAHFGPLPR
jgi:hypothetical protein